MIIAGTGSRSLVLEPHKMNKVKLLLCRWMEIGKDRYPDDFLVISGLAEGFDEILAIAAIESKVPFDAYVPTASYGNYYWGQNSLTGKSRKNQFDTILKHAREIVTVCDRLYIDGKHANFVRNEAMVDAADRVWAWNPSSSGTRQCVAYAYQQQKPISEVNLP